MHPLRNLPGIPGKPNSSLRVTIYALLLLSFFLGLPQFHYMTALMIMIIIRRKDVPGGLLAPVIIPLPRFNSGLH